MSKYWLLILSKRWFSLMVLIISRFVLTSEAFFSRLVNSVITSIALVILCADLYTTKMIIQTEIIRPTKTIPTVRKLARRNAESISFLNSEA